ncbi:MAG: RecQ family ATP-dependent DNA helicase [Tepidisphaeraceae bacterium]
MSDLLDQLHSHFGLRDFRLMQREVIEDVLAGQDVVCVMPTGAGKSLCYQLPAVVQGGLTLVVSPLISLMEDQVRQLRERNIPAHFLNSSQPIALQRDVLAEVSGDFNGLLYVAPERFAHPGFQAAIAKLSVRLLAIDEAHCVSQWGHDFRPEYAQLGQVRTRLGSPVTIALTATATDDVREDIIHLLHLREPRMTITGFDRPNLRYAARCVDRAREKDDVLHELVKASHGSGLVYCATRRTVDELAIELKRQFPDRMLIPYHAGMPQEERPRNQQLFMQTPNAITVATNAFGMGINKPDIRFVVHYDLPATVEAYYQEAGRAGRDGEMSDCTLIYHFGDRSTQEFFIDKIGQDAYDVDPQWIATLKERATAKLDLMVRYARSPRCRRLQILEYFGDESAVEQCACDVCRGALDEGEITPELTTLVRQLLSGIARLNGRFGLTAVAEVLAGVESERTQKWQLDQLSVFGLLKHHSSKVLISMLHRVVEAGLARLRDPEGLRRPMIELTPAGAAVMKAQTPVPGVLGNLVPSSTRAAPKARPKRAAEEAVALDDVGKLVFEELRRVRGELAREHDLPAYVICHDKTLALIAQHRPQTPESLEHIKGFGPHKVRLYGERLLAVVQGA